MCPRILRWSGERRNEPAPTGCVWTRVVVEGRIVTESPPLPLDEQQKRTVLVESLRKSHHAGMTQPYYLLRPFGTNNCNSYRIEVLIL